MQIVALHTNELRAFAYAVLGMLESAFPFHYGPAIEIISRHLGKHCAEIDLPMTKRPEATSAIDPRLIAPIDALPPGRIELRILDVEHANYIFVDVDVVQTIQTLQHLMRRIIQHLGALMVAHTLQKYLERHAVVQVFTGVYFEAQINAVAVRVVKNESSAFCQLVNGHLDQPRRALRPRIDIRPSQRAGKRRLRRQPQMRERI